MENSSCLTQRCAQAPSISMCIWLFFLPLKFPEHPLILWGRWEAGGPGGICPPVWPWFYHAEMGNEGGKAQLRQSLCSLPSLGKKKTRKMNHHRNIGQGGKKQLRKVFKLLQKKWRSIPVLLPFDFAARRRGTGNPKSACWAEWMLSPQIKRGRRCQKFSPANSFSPNILITLLWIQTFPSG